MLQKVRFLHTMMEKVVNTKTFHQCLKKVQILSYANGKCTAQFTVAEEHLNGYGTLHGGFTSTIIDDISSYALKTLKPDQLSGVSVDLHVTFLKAAFAGEVVTVNAKVIHAGKKMAFLEVELTKNDGKDIIARGQHTKYIIVPNKN